MLQLAYRNYTKVAFEAGHFLELLLNFEQARAPQGPRLYPVESDANLPSLGHWFRRKKQVDPLLKAIYTGYESFYRAVTILGFVEGPLIDSCALYNWEISTRVAALVRVLNASESSGAEVT